MANRSQAFIRGLYANAQSHNLTSLVRRSGREAVASTDRASKRKRTDEENLVAIGSPNVISTAEPTRLDGELFSCLFDHNNRCTIFDLDDPGNNPSNVSTMEMELERFKLSPCSLNVPSSPPALVQISATPMPADVATTFTSLPVVIPRGDDAEGKPEPTLSDSEFLAFFDQNMFLEDEADTAMSVPTMEMKRSKHSPSRLRPQVPTESPALVQVGVTPTPPPALVNCASPVKTTCDTDHTRHRPYKNVRERRRRAEMKTKFMQLYNLCCSKAVASIVSKPGTEATGLLIPISGSACAHALVNQEPSKVDILDEAILAFEALDNELKELKARNTELRMKKLSHA